MDQFCVNPSKRKSYQKYIDAISASGLSIYDAIKIGDLNLWIPLPELENLLNDKLKGISLKDLPLRTRSKVVKEKICQVLGYPVPTSFKKCRPRFTGQQFDTCIQKSNNLQIWNEGIKPKRRYVLIRVSKNDKIERVKVVLGSTLAKYDTTGTLTQKYQARVTIGSETTELITPRDTDNLAFLLKKRKYPIKFKSSPISLPMAEEFLPITIIFQRISKIVGQSFSDPGKDQERNRGAMLHQLVCNTLGYCTYRNGGCFPDILHQLLEVKLQTSPTIDLGLVLPNSQESLDIPLIAGRQFRYCDARYAIFIANIESRHVVVSNLYLTTGEAFFSRFKRFEGKVLNRKLQLPLPMDFFQD